MSNESMVNISCNLHFWQMGNFQKCYIYNCILFEHSKAVIRICKIDRISYLRKHLIAVP